jgi:hypothetical protein
VDHLDPRLAEESNADRSLVLPFFDTTMGTTTSRERRQDEIASIEQEGIRARPSYTTVVHPNDVERNALGRPYAGRRRISVLSRVRGQSRHMT